MAVDPVTISTLAEAPEDRWAIWDGILVRRLDDTRYIGIKPFLYTYAVIWGYLNNDYVYEDRWCYHTAVEAAVAATVWDGTGEPQGWHRHPASGRRRTDGDPAREYVAP